ncbi:hypothetical protein [Tepidibacter formicigenes]|jgi:multisubunit Na+/H+ antiporter MnhE subunit|uniref:Uncharacterized protein n=1 Tax=Tepidibacter formicigenes DSM 15518 TaxID=1123349 RepID=A0A1M6NW96_9FIRM|nr:hypothetical protein [Tepidibacter formicigenes]SHK00029.1 hypothetical protein SAMN02744037_01390 [Tepidibacter formicigenes DSM 15518]
MKKIGMTLFSLLTFWNVLEGKINIETILVGLLICLFVYKFNKETFITK